MITPKYPAGPYRYEKIPATSKYAYTLLEEFPLSTKSLGAVCHPIHLEGTWEEAEALAKLFAGSPQTMLILQSLIQALTRNRSKESIDHWIHLAQNHIHKTLNLQPDNNENNN